MALVEGFFTTKQPVAVDRRGQRIIAGLDRALREIRQSDEGGDYAKADLRLIQARAHRLCDQIVKRYRAVFVARRV